MREEKERKELKRKAVYGIFVALLLLVGMLTLALNIQPLEASGTIYIRANGAVEPPTPLIWTADNITYTFTGDITDSIVIQRSNIIVDGQSHMLQSPTSGSGNGFFWSSVANVTIRNANIRNFNYGVSVGTTGHNVISGNNITNNVDGIVLYSNYNDVSGNNLTANSSYGIVVYSSYNSVSGNNITQSNVGILLSTATSGNTLSRNNVTANKDRGIEISSSSNNVLRNNHIAGYKYNFKVIGSTLSHFMHDIDVSNAVDGKPIYYWVNKKDAVVPADAGYIAVVNSSGITVQGQKGTRNWQGILLAYTENSAITQNNVTSNYDGISLFSSSNNIISENNVTANNNYGISLASSSNNNSISGNEIRANLNTNIDLSSSSNYNSIIRNNITQTQSHGISLSSSNYNNITENNIANNALGSAERAGVYLGSSSNYNNVSGNNITANDFGIQVGSSNNNHVSGNNVTQNRGCGIYIGGSSNTFSGNNITANTGAGVYILGTYNIISRNNITANNDGISIYASSGPNTISENTIAANGQCGISLTSTSNAVLQNNTIANNKYNFKVYGSTLSHFIHDIDYSNKVDGKPIYYLVNKQDKTVPTNAGFVALVNSTGMTIEGVDIENNWDGILLAYTKNSTITQSNITKNEFGIRLYYSSNNTIYRNHIFGSQITPKQKRGIYLSYSSYNVMYENNITANSLWGIVLEYASNYNNISGNYIAKHGWGLTWGASPSGGIDIYTSSNYNSISGNNITENNAFGIRLFSSSNNNIVSENNITTTHGTGILLQLSSNYNVMSENNLTGNWGNGMYLETSSYNSMSGNIIANNGLSGTYSGINLASSNYNSINGNQITENNQYGVLMSGSNNNNVSANNIIASTQDGIYLSSSKYNILSGNNATANNRYGISLYSSSNNNSIIANNITDNKQRGITLTSSSNNTIYHNNFINNVKQVSSTTSVNIWDDGYPSGGNHWSNYTGLDNYRGIYQNETGSDGVGDTYHVIDASNADHYPLTKPYRGPHDIGIPSIRASKTVVGQGYYCTITITVKIINYGLSPDNFDLNVYVNTVPLASETVTLISRNSTTVAFTWDTTGLAKGSYTISAYVTPVPGETDTTDNSATIIVKVTIPGDVNGDWIVNVHDLYLIGKAYGSTPAYPNWNPNADINNSNTVDNTDLSIASENYGQVDP